jgi:hypothetical protein
MDECLPFGSLDGSTLQMLLARERARSQELEQEVLRLRAALAPPRVVVWTRASIGDIL